MTTYCTQPLNKEGHPVGSWHFEAESDEEALEKLESANVRHTPLEKISNGVYVRVVAPEETPKTE